MAEPKPNPFQPLVDVMRAVDCRMKNVEMLLADIAGKEVPGFPEEKPDIYIAIPSGGGSMDLDVGEYQFDFYNGRIIDPDGDETSMPLSLLTRGFEYCRSLRVETDQDVLLNFDIGGGKRTVEAANPVRLSYLEYRVAYIQTTVPTTIKLWASTAPMALIQDSLSVFVDSPSVTIPSGVVSLGSVFNTAVNAATNIFASNLEIQNNGILRVTIGLTGAAIFRARVTRGGVTVTLDYNDGGALTAGAAYIFDLGVQKDDEINFQLSAGTTVRMLNATLVTR